MLGNRIRFFGKNRTKLTFKKTQEAFISWQSVSGIETKPTFFKEQNPTTETEKEKNKNQDNQEITSKNQRMPQNPKMVKGRKKKKKRGTFLG